MPERNPRPTLRGSDTERNLRQALVSESVSSRRYLYFAQQAAVDGHPEVAALFRAAAEGETGHALGHLDVLAELEDDGTGGTGAGPGETADHLRASAAAERVEAEQMYPAFAARAREEGFPDIAEWLDRMADAEAEQAARFRSALDELETTRGGRTIEAPR